MVLHVEVEGHLVLNPLDRKSTRLNSSHLAISHAVFCLKKRALGLEQDGTLVAIVSADFLGLPAVLGERVRAAVKDIPAQNILIGATHTYCLKDCDGSPDLPFAPARASKY